MLREKTAQQEQELQQLEQQHHDQVLANNRWVRSLHE